MFENMMLNDLEKVTGGCQVNYDQNGNPYITPAHMDCAKARTDKGDEWSYTCFDSWKWENVR